MSEELAERISKDLKYDNNGLVPAIAQHAHSGKILMLGFMNQEAIFKTISTRKLHFFSRSRNSLWLKGETSGAIHDVTDIYYDCDQDAVLVMVEPKGPTCHTGKESCFFKNLETNEEVEPPSSPLFLTVLDRVLEQRVRDTPEGSYTSLLLKKGREKYLKKINEEAFEFVHAALTESQERVVEEAADLLFHLMLALQAEGMDLETIVRELERRHKPDPKK